MKALILLAALGVVFATDNIDINNSGNDGGNVHQTVNIDNHDNVANINQYNGWHSWNSVWDYGRSYSHFNLMGTPPCVHGGNFHPFVLNNLTVSWTDRRYHYEHMGVSSSEYNGLFAARLMSKRACVVSRMNRNMAPSLEQLSKASQEKVNPNAPPPRTLTYSVSQTRVKNVAQFGNHIEALCKGVPTFYAQETQGAGLFVNLQGCTNLGILRFLGISLCGNIGC